MPKVTASLADVQTGFQLPEPGVHQFKIKEVQDKSQPGKEAYMVVSEVDEPGTDDHGRKVFDYCAFTKRDGGKNGFGLSRFKEYFEATLGAEVVADPSFEYDTDELVNGRFQAEVYHETYEKNSEDGTKQPPRTNAKLRRVLPLD